MSLWVALYNEGSSNLRALLSMCSRFLVCTLLAALTMPLVTSVAQCKTEAECLEAIEVGNELVNENPSNYRGYASRGGAYNYLKKYDLAERDLLKAISLNPSFAGLYVHLGAVYYATRKYEQSLVAIRKAIELGADSQATYDSLLGSLCMSQHFEECLKKSDEVLAEFPTDGDAYFFRAVSKSELKGFTKADVLSDLSKAHSLKPEDEAVKRIYESALAGKALKFNRR